VGIVPKVSQEHRDARRAQILDGARTAFAKYGYDGATVARLEGEVGLSRGAIFNYFAGKRDLFVGLAIEENRRYIGLIVEKGLDDAIRAMASENPEWLGVVLEIQGRLRHDEEFQRRMTEETEADRQRLVEWFMERQQDGTFRRDVDVMELGRFATMVLNGLALRVAGGDETDLEAALRMLHDALGPRQ
jgi:AcrR family transcriptional regulator